MHYSLHNWASNWILVSARCWAAGPCPVSERVEWHASQPITVSHTRLTPPTPPPKFRLQNSLQNRASDVTRHCVLAAATFCGHACRLSQVTLFHFGPHSLEAALLTHFNKHPAAHAGSENAKHYTDISRLLHMSAVEKEKDGRWSECEWDGSD